jgi:hypothetical protein
MNSLSSKHRAFIALMKKGEDNERRGFELLLQRADFPIFLMPLRRTDYLIRRETLGPFRSTSPVITAFHIGRHSLISKPPPTLPEKRSTQPSPKR